MASHRGRSTDSTEQQANASPASSLPSNMSLDFEANEITKEQLSDVYAAGTSDGILKREEGLIRVSADGYPDEQADGERETPTHTRT